MKKVILSLLFLVFSLNCLAQGEANIWYFGVRAGLDFNSGSPVALTDGQINTQEGSAVISNAAGQLLFYTDGITVWDKNHNIMPNGSGLLGHPSSSQSALVVPKTGSPNIYYLFTISDKATADGFRYSEVDMSLNGGFGDVTNIKNIPIQTPVCEKLTAVKNANNDGYWVLVHGFGDDAFYAYSITSAGINMTPVITHVGITVQNDQPVKAIGYLKFSPSGSKVMVCHSRNNIAELFDFNRTTGILSNAKTISTRERCYGAEFSMSENIAYVTSEATGSLNPDKIYQYDLTAANIPSTEVVLYATINTDYSTVSGALQMGPDGKIYNAGVGNFKLNVINNPEVLGVGCNFMPEIIDLGPGPQWSYHGLPQFVQSTFESAIKAQNLCLGSITNFSLSNTQNVTNVVWNFGDGLPTQNGLTPTHTYASTGVYNVVATITSPSGVTTKNKQVVISPMPFIANVITNKFVCGTANSSYDLSQFNTTLLGSQSSSTFGVSYFLTLGDANSNSNVLPINFTLPLGLTTFYAKVSTIDNPSCSVLTSFNVSLSQQPIANQPIDYVICESAPYDNIEQFDLTTKNNQVLNGQSSSDFTITYHSFLADANNGTDALPLLYTNTLPLETLFVRIENNNNQNCFATTTLVIRVVQEPTLSPVSDFRLCDDNTNSGVENFNLSLKTTEILNGQSPAVFEVKYYYSLTDAQTETNEIMSSIDNTANPQPIYYTIRLIGNSACSIIGSFNLAVNKMPIVNQPVNLTLCDDSSNDGAEVFNLQSNLLNILGTQNPNDFNLSYHLSPNDADLNINAQSINFPNTANPQVIFVRVESKANVTCYATTSFQLAVYKKPIANQPPDLITCGDSVNNGEEFFELNDQTASVLEMQSASEFTVTYHLLSSEAIAGTNPLSGNYRNTSNPQTIYARVTNNLNNQCFDTTTFSLIVYPKPELFMDDVYSICEGSSITVSAPLGYSGYTWSNGENGSSATISEAGNYSVTVTKDYGTIICDFTKNFVVYNSNIATIVDVKVSDWTINENSIQIFVTGDGDYEYSIDGINYQTSSQISGLPSGNYTVYVRDRKGCGIATDEVYILMYPKVFTPNGDGFNDLWNINYVENEPEIMISIFDRYGKLLKVISGKENGWNGKLNNQILPATDYWFVVKRKEGKEYKGHFSLKR